MVLRKKYIFIGLILTMMVISACSANSVMTATDNKQVSYSTVEENATEGIITTEEQPTAAAETDTEKMVPDQPAIAVKYSGEYYELAESITDVSKVKLTDDMIVGEIQKVTTKEPTDDLTATFSWVGNKLYLLDDGRIAVYMDRSTEDGVTWVQSEPRILILKKVE